ncbi:phage tail sheath family protein [Haloferula chungangensis]|uniref:Phage tail sheath family protein n=1 Tax=Haloferula chungangensis TaxID=1048331 RepID=A0ABW2L2C9_9BACT
MASYLHPGVYIEEIPSGSKPIEGVSTSVAAFVGVSPQGPSGEAVLIQNLEDYKTDFGGVASETDEMGLAIQAFYLNGGRSAYICRIVGGASTSASNSVTGEGTGATPTLIISARNEGDWGNSVFFRIIKPDTFSTLFTLEVGHRENNEFVADEVFPNLSMRAEDSNYALTQVNDTSSLVRLSVESTAAELGNTAAQYQDAVIVGSQPPADDAHFTSNVSIPASLTLNINGIGAQMITVNTVLTGNQTADGNALAADVEAAVHALGAADHLQAFTCTYNGVTRRFTLTSPEDGSQASLTIFNGELARAMGIDPGQRATLTGGALPANADHFSAALAGFSQPMDLVLNIDNLGNRTISLNAATLGLSGDNANDGAIIAAAIQTAVRAINPASPTYRDFTAIYNGSNEFVLRSGSSEASSSQLTVSAGELATHLELDTGTTVGGRTVSQGSSAVIPIESLGLLNQGTSLEDGSLAAPTPADFSSFFENVLRKVRDVSILVMPGQQWAADGSGSAVLSAGLAHCESLKNRVLIIDPEEGLELDQGATVDEMGLPTSTYSVLYYPWVAVANPFYNVDTNPTASRTLNIGPSSLAAGMWAKIDGKRGVWKAPAGVETQLLGVSGLQYAVGDGEQDQLNPLGVNCIRSLPSYGSVIWGARTRSTKADPEWRYVPVRRTAIFIEQSIFNGIQWAVFEGNDTPLWGSLRANIGGFMNGLFRAGAFQGKTANDAYFVRCGLGDTMTQADIDRGQVIVVVGFAPLKPAEFVIVRIQQKVNQQ